MVVNCATCKSYQLWYVPFGCGPCRLFVICASGLWASPWPPRASQGAPTVIQDPPRNFGMTQTSPEPSSDPKKVAKDLGVTDDCPMLFNLPKAAPRTSQELQAPYKEIRRWPQVPAVPPKDPKKPPRILKTTWPSAPHGCSHTSRRELKGL